MIPLIDIGALFGPDSPARREVDAAISDAAQELGFLQLHGLPRDVPLGAEVRRDLLRVFSLPDEQKQRLWRRAWAPQNPNVYRGYFPLSAGVIKEGIDIGPERQPGEANGDALAEPTPLPGESSLPGWRSAVYRSFSALERVATSRSFRQFTLGLTSMLKERSITSMLTSTTYSVDRCRIVTKAEPMPVPVIRPSGLTVTRLLSETT